MRIAYTHRNWQKNSRENECSMFNLWAVVIRIIIDFVVFYTYLQLTVNSPPNIAFLVRIQAEKVLEIGLAHGDD